MSLVIRETTTAFQVVNDEGDEVVATFDRRGGFKREDAQRFIDEDKDIEDGVPWCEPCHSYHIDTPTIEKFNTMQCFDYRRGDVFTMNRDPYQRYCKVWEFGQEDRLLYKTIAPDGSLSEIIRAHPRSGLTLVARKADANNLSEAQQAALADYNQRVVETNQARERQEQSYYKMRLLGF